jgi:hypothetical protein
MSYRKKLHLFYQTEVINKNTKHQLILPKELDILIKHKHIN